MTAPDDAELARLQAEAEAAEAALKLAQAKAADIQSRYAAEFGRPVQIEHKLDAQQMDAGSRRSLVEDKEQAMHAERARRRRESAAPLPPGTPARS